MTDLTLDMSSTALVLIDLQVGITSMETQPHSAREVIDRAVELADRFRERRGTVVLVHVDPGPRWELFPQPPVDRPRPPRTTPMPPDWTEIVPELGPEPGDVLVTKHQPGAFYGTDLDVHLRRRAIKTIVIGGISTNIGVEATARVAYEAGYALVFVEDMMAAREADLHAHAVTRFFPTIGRVRTADDVLSALG